MGGLVAPGGSAVGVVLGVVLDAEEFDELLSITKSTFWPTYRVSGMSFCAIVTPTNAIPLGGPPLVADRSDFVSNWPGTNVTAA
jgi:hypothetical protein